MLDLPEEAPRVGQVRRWLLRGPELPWGQRGGPGGVPGLPGHPVSPSPASHPGIARRSSAVGLKPHTSGAPGRGAGDHGGCNV